MRDLVLLLTALLAVACQGPPSGYGADRFPNVTSYHVRLDRVTPHGVRYGGDLDAEALDRRVDAVEACLAAVREPTRAEREAAGGCLVVPIRRDVDRGAIGVFLAPDRYVSACSGEELFPCRVTEASCAAKGLAPDPRCPCACRATVQDDAVVVTNAKMNVLAGELTRLVTSCWSTWVPPLADCARIGTAP